MKKPPAMGAIVLAGGKSKRMKCDKALLPVTGQPLIERVIGQLEPLFSQILVCARDPRLFRFLPHPVVVDEQEGQGPMMGILTGLKASSFQDNFVTGCDIPDIHIPFIEKMTAYVPEYEIVVPRDGDGRYEPLFAFYNKSVVPRIEALLAGGERQILKLYPLCRTREVLFENKDWYYNLNTLEDYHEYLKSPGRR